MLCCLCCWFVGGLFVCGVVLLVCCVVVVCMCCFVDVLCCGCESFGIVYVCVLVCLFVCSFA